MVCLVKIVKRLVPAGIETIINTTLRIFYFFSGGGGLEKILFHSSPSCNESSPEGRVGHNSDSKLAARSQEVCARVALNV